MKLDNILILYIGGGEALNYSNILMELLNETGINTKRDGSYQVDFNSKLYIRN